jgi:hypothetical protein
MLRKQSTLGVKSHELHPVVEVLIGAACSG